MIVVAQLLTISIHVYREHAKTNTETHIHAHMLIKCTKTNTRLHLQLDFRVKWFKTKKEKKENLKI